MKAKELTFAVSPAVDLSVRIVFHPSWDALRGEWFKEFGMREDGTKAFCLYHDNKDKVIASLHFQPESSDTLTIAHEVLHCVLQLGRRLHLTIFENQAEEILATAMETVLGRTLKFRRSLKL